MKRTVKLLVGVFCIPVLLMFGLVSGCTENSNHESGAADLPNVEPTLGIFKVDKSNLEDVFPSPERAKDGSIIEGSAVNLKKIKLESKPILTDLDIKEYNWKNQELKLSEEYLIEHGFSESDKAMSEYIDFTYRDGGSRLLGTSQGDAVVVTLNGKRIYSAGFLIALTSSHAKPPIMFEDVGRNILRINNYRKTDDLRQDKEIYNFFKKEGKLKE